MPKLDDIDFDANDPALHRQSVEEFDRRKAEIRIAVYGYYTPHQSKNRVQEIKTKAKEVGATSNVCVKNDLIEVIGEAVQAKHQGAQAQIISAIEDIESSEDVDRELWREAVVAYLEDNGIKLHVLDMDKEAFSEMRKLPLATTIRKYNRLRRRLEDAIDSKIKEGKVKKACAIKTHGRPPYGYTSTEGVLSINRAQAEAVMLIFTRRRQGRITRDIIEELKEKFAYICSKDSPKGVKQHWDYVKIKRILTKADLYCLGRYSWGSGTVIESKELAFLPREWVDTV